ncbi:lipid II:glycine glycyltransferase FemX [Halocatena pleomorpha]|uniref:GNAT family N-acetyltransferase n=1 Tax=Halocatena pleomorpha TaxID=1785090 RepID=A0A3P3RJZ4_9EURY|nr:GNAT family N-acetyltransferase [Halocatena pleomorpha]RRJ33654.1 GNAT family N-acetyltransferase [Halocatena pleomorpha]
MGVEIERVKETETWNRLVERSPQTCLFHRDEALSIQADHTGADVHRLVGYVGEEPIGVFPLFELSRGPVRLLFSPPPELRVTYLGPALLNGGGLKQRKRERRQHEFIEGCFEWAKSAFNPRYGHLRIHSCYEDIRPFLWNDCEVTPSYTYLVDLTQGTDDLLMSFSRDARSNIRDAAEASYTIEEGGRTAIYDIVEQVDRRYARQGISYHVTPAFVTELANSLPEGAVRPYTLRIDGEFIGGLIALDDGETVYRWQGGVRSDTSTDVPVNDLLDWHVMTEAIDRDRSAYDLVGADNPRINRYKAKFNPELVPFYNVEHGSTVTTTLARAYQWVRRLA